MVSDETVAPRDMGSSGNGRYLATILLMFASASVGGLLTYAECHSSRANPGWIAKALAVLTGGGLSAVAVPVAWKLGHFLGQLGQPDLIFTTGAVDLAKKRIGFALLPPVLGAAAVVMSVVYVVPFAGKRCGVPGETIQIRGAAPSQEQKQSVIPESPALVTPHSDSSPQSKTGGTSDRPLSLERRKVTPSFDCEKASVSAESFICRDESLTSLDNALSDNYKALLASALSEAGRRELKATQRLWLAERNRCTNPECVRELYHQRIYEVCRYPIYAGVRPHCRSAEEVVLR
jgi:hypothetical protein